MELVGREAELSEIASLCRRAEAGCAALTVVAEPGLGKSALLAAAARGADEDGYRVLRCVGVEAESALQYSALTDLLEPILAEVAGWLSPPQRHALDVIARRAEPDDQPVDRHAVARAALAAVAQAAHVAPTLVIIDDAQWIDAESRHAVAFVVRRAAQFRLAVLVARRVESESGPDELDRAIQTLGHGRDGRLRLAPLTPGQVERLLAEHGLALPRAPLRRIQALAGGNPLFALELARAAIADPDLPLTVPRSLVELLRRRIGRLPPQTVTALAAAAQLAAPTRTLVAHAVGGDRASVDAALDCAVDARVLTEREDVLRFAHPLLAEAASGTADAAFRRLVHRRLADAVTDVEHRALHLSMAHSEPDAAVADAIEAGARRARERAAPEVAGELLAAALRLTPREDDAGRRRRRVDCAYHWVAAGKIDTGIRMLAAALADEPPGEGRADLRWRSAMLHFLDGDVAACVALLSSALDETADDALREQLRTRLASMYAWLGNLRDSAAIADRVDLARLTALGRITARGTSALAHFLLGDPLPEDPRRLVAEFENLDPPPAAHEHPAGRLLMTLLPFRPAAEAIDIATRAYQRAVDEEDDLGQAWSGWALARALLHAGRWPQAAEVANEALRAGRRADSRPGLVLALAAAAGVAAHRGEVADARALAEELMQLHRPQPLIFCVEQGRLQLGFLALSSGDADTAVREFAAASAALAHCGQVEPSMPPPRWLLLEALLDAGRIADAETEAGTLVAYAERRDHPLAASMGWTGRGRIAAVRGDRAAVDAAFAAALAAHDRLGWPFERAVTLFAQGRSHRLLDRRSMARESLAAAADAFGALGAPLWERRARDELAGISGRAPAPATALTLAERRVAELAASGLTNQEIADALFVSTKTVATHLTHAYAKLQLRSRTELARHFSAPA